MGVCKSHLSLNCTFQIVVGTPIGPNSKASQRSGFILQPSLQWRDQSKGRAKGIPYNLVGIVGFAMGTKAQFSNFSLAPTSASVWRQPIAMYSDRGPFFQGCVGLYSFKHCCCRRFRRLHCTPLHYKSPWCFFSTMALKPAERDICAIRSAFRHCTYGLSAYP